MVVWEIENRVFELEGVRIVIRGKQSDKLGNYNYTRKAAGNASITEWLEQRVHPVLDGYDVAVIDGSGRIAHGRMKMETLRNSYVE